MVAHDAHLVRPILQRVDSAADERPKEIVAGHSLIHQLDEDLVNQIDLLLLIPRVVFPIPALDPPDPDLRRQIPSDAFPTRSEGIYHLLWLGEQVLAAK